MVFDLKEGLSATLPNDHYNKESFSKRCQISVIYINFSIYFIKKIYKFERAAYSIIRKININIKSKKFIKQFGIHKNYNLQMYKNV